MSANRPPLADRRRLHQFSQVIQEGRYSEGAQVNRPVVRKERPAPRIAPCASAEITRLGTGRGWNGRPWLCSGDQGGWAARAVENAEGVVRRVLVL